MEDSERDQWLAFDRDEVEDAVYMASSDISLAEVERALQALEYAHSKGFVGSRAVFVKPKSSGIWEFDGLWERAVPDDARFDWGRHQKISDRYFFDHETMALVPDPNYDPTIDASIVATWTTEAGYRCMVRENTMGSYCGYVQVSTNHPFYGRDYNQGLAEPEPLPEIMRRLREDDFEYQAPDFAYEGEPWESEDVVHAKRFGRLWLEVGERDMSRGTVEGLLSVHGGVTFAGTFEGIPGWWIGFDTAHMDDLPSPEYRARWADRYGGELPTWKLGGRHWTIDDVKVETERLAEQIAAYDTLDKIPQVSKEPTEEEVEDGSEA
jgi:hypothetical protein